MTRDRTPDIPPFRVTVESALAEITLGIANKPARQIERETVEAVRAVVEGEPAASFDDGCVQ